MTAPIAILGAGPSGLTLGRLLEVAGIDYIIFERDELQSSIVGNGGTLDIHLGSGQVALQEAGLIDQFRSLARYDVPVVLADAKGTVHARFSENGDSERPEIDRKDLRTLLLKSIPAHRVRWASKIQSVQRDANGSISIHFTNGSIESGFRLVVGADGAWSKARSLVTSAKPQYSGLHYLTTHIMPKNHFYRSAVSLVGQGNYLGIGGGKQIPAQKLGDGSYYIAVGLRLPEHWSSENSALLKNPEELRRLLLHDYFIDWPQVHTDLIKYSEGNFHDWPLYAMPTESLSWETTPGLTLVGDAAHVTTPFEGEGVNCAMYDSVQLAQQIVKYGLNDLNSAVSEYEKMMFPRAIDLIERSEKNGELLFAADAPKGFLQAMFGADSA
ncbi:MAG: hypothetical protein M1820_005386 [Bogoriella megaspora]|nr:MAG: hypothetical protein M1820_005386 [Bogoriella megaspora]